MLKRPKIDRVYFISNQTEQFDVKIFNEELILDLIKNNLGFILLVTLLPLPSGKSFASYRSPVGRLAEVPLGDEARITIDGYFEC
jgi:hypothetical protein